MSKSEIEVHVRWMIRPDLPKVLDIENEVFRDPWTEDEFINTLRQRNVIGMTAEHGGRVLGYMIYELKRRAINVLNMAVKERYQGCSIGQQMVEKLIGKLHCQRRNRITILVSEPNLDAQLFYKAMGFVAEAIVESPYNNGNLDAYEFVYHYHPENDPHLQNTELEIVK